VSSDLGTVAGADFGHFVITTGANQFNDTSNNPIAFRSQIHPPDNNYVINNKQEAQEKEKKWVCNKYACEWIFGFSG